MTTTPIALPGLKQLFADSWQLTKERWWPMLLLWLIQGILFALIMGGAMIALFATSFGALVNSQLFDFTVPLENLPEASILAPVFGVIVAALLIAVVIATIAGPLFQAASIALAGSAEKISVGAALRLGISKFMSVVTAGLLMSFFIFGGLFALVIPGLILMILLSFALYEIVLYRATPMQALRNSAGMVKAHFWPVVGRLAMLLLLGIAISLIGESWTNMNNPLFSLVDLVLNLGYSVLAVMYSVVLYKNLRAATPGASMSLVPLGIISALGWLMAIVLIGNFLRTV